MLDAYIGITDFTSPEQVTRMQEHFVRLGGHKVGRKLGVGVMMSYETLHGLESKWAKVFPPKERIAKIFAVCDPRYSFGVLHYVDYEDRDVTESLERVVAYGGSRMEAMQLDMTWPEALELKMFRERHPHVKLILQVGEEAMRLAGNDPQKVVDRVLAYGYAVDAILLDFSKRKGTEMNAEKLLPFARALRDSCPMMSFVGAGGLGPTTVELAEPLLREFLEMSLDAQSKLRPSGSSLDPIDWGLGSAYLRKAFELVKRCQEMAAVRARDPWRSFAGKGYRLENLGRPAVFYIPVPKQAIEGVLPPAEVEMREYLKKEFSAFSTTIIPTFGFWVDGENRIWYDDCRQYEVAFVGADRIKPLVAELAKYAKAVGEKCLYFKAGEDACLIWPQD